MISRKFKDITGTDERGKVGDRIISEDLYPSLPFRVVTESEKREELFSLKGNNDIINKMLKELKKNEPTSDNEFFRLAIINYELGDLNRAIVYSNRFKNSKKALFRDGFKDRDVILSEGKLAMADLLTQLNMLCISMDWDFTELRKLGAEHLKERQKDFQSDGWSEVK